MKANEMRDLSLDKYLKEKSVEKFIDELKKIAKDGVFKANIKAKHSEDMYHLLVKLGYNVGYNWKAECWQIEW